LSAVFAVSEATQASVSVFEKRSASGFAEFAIGELLAQQFRHCC
jgi:hypothetical protein